ncbi:MAG TPA: hypothetical protein VH062_15615 [Polyangiaceae bacterium]|jgi:hypothetical protein|nr:hypothetical protein [Polyangiaceae bacterium]
MSELIRRWFPPERRKLLLDAWQKYGLIVIGNVVFFALLYFVQYRPNSRENRAGELLTLAQREEAEHRLEAAESLYATIVADYTDERPASVARERLPKVRALAQKQREVQPPLPAACAPSVDVQVLLEERPSFYLAELVAGQYPSIPEAQRDRYFNVLDGYVWLALNRDHVALSKFQDSSTFRAAELRERYFTPKASARYAPDLMYDDFKVRNIGYFTLHAVVIELSVSQEGRTERGSVRVAEMALDAEADVLEFDVKKHGGTVEVQGSIVANEGKVEWHQRL